MKGKKTVMSGALPGPHQLILMVLGQTCFSLYSILCFSEAAKRWNRAVLNNTPETQIEHARFILMDIQFIIFN